MQIPKMGSNMKIEYRKDDQSCHSYFQYITLFGWEYPRIFIRISIEEQLYLSVLDSIVVSIPACHAGDQGSIPCRGGLFTLEEVISQQFISTFLSAKRLVLHFIKHHLPNISYLPCCWRHISFRVTGPFPCLSLSLATIFVYYFN